MHLTTFVRQKIFLSLISARRRFRAEGHVLIFGCAPNKGAPIPPQSDSRRLNGLPNSSVNVITNVVLMKRARPMCLVVTATSCRYKSTARNCGLVLIAL
jgi:hypothetical protein